MSRCECCGEESSLFRQRLCRKCFYSIASRFVVIHFRPNKPTNRLSACSVSHPELYAYDGRDVTCKNCHKTKAWKAYMGKAVK